MYPMKSPICRISGTIAFLALSAMSVSADANTLHLVRGAAAPPLESLKAGLAAAGLDLAETVISGSAGEQQAGLLDQALAVAAPMAMVLPMGRDSTDLVRAGAMADIGPALALEDGAVLIDPACTIAGRLGCIPIGSGSACTQAGPLAVFFPASDDASVVAMQWQAALTLFDAEIAEALGTGGFCTRPASGG